jgi:hypothetical protein
MINDFTTLGHHRLAGRLPRALVVQRPAGGFLGGAHGQVDHKVPWRLRAAVDADAMCEVRGRRRPRARADAAAALVAVVLVARGHLDLAGGTCSVYSFSICGQSPSHSPSH